MEVKIGVQHAPRELVVESDEDVEALEKAIADAVADGTRVLTLTDKKGRRTMVPSSKIAYVEIGSTVVGKVGFRG
ncbi:DUF3107 domain-containing protein [Nocardioides insulae]|uniref:DUF3107 domain-containing protein n=1 Tax=Nocardioides insulae TaxID=394734 RepID=UPI0003FB03E9|nr:DUF3107 domain-containing protein [Nocardioides insulae]